MFTHLNNFNLSTVGVVAWQKGLFFPSHHKTVNSPWCICQAGRGKGRFLDGPFESFQWWSPAPLSARSSLPAPALGSPSSSCYGHFEQLKENKGLGLASTMTCKRMTWSLKRKWMSLDWNENKIQFERQQRTPLLVSVCFSEWLWKRRSKMSSSTLKCCTRTGSLELQCALSAQSKSVSLEPSIRREKTKAENQVVHRWMLLWQILAISVLVYGADKVRA